MNSMVEDLNKNNNCIENQIQKEIADTLKVILIHRLNLQVSTDEILYDTQLFNQGLGLDSVDALEVVAAVDEEYGVSLTQEDNDYFQNLITLSKLILERKQQ